MFSPGGTKPGESPSSDSSATYVDPDLVEKTVGEGTKENAAIREGIEEITDPNAPTLKDPPLSMFPIPSRKARTTKDVPSDGEVVKEHIIISIEETKTDASTEGMISQNEGNPDDVTGNPHEGLIGESGNDESSPHDESSNAASEEWKTIMDKRTARKNKKARKNKEKQQKSQAKLLRRQAKYGPEWAQQGGILPASSGSASRSPRRSSSESKQNSQLQENSGDGSNSNGSPDARGERSDSESRADPQPDPNLSGGSQGGGDDETKTEGSNNGNQSDFH
jgi:hypothetical protein